MQLDEITFSDEGLKDQLFQGTDRTQTEKVLISKLIEEDLIVTTIMEKKISNK